MQTRAFRMAALAAIAIAVSGCAYDKQLHFGAGAATSGAVKAAGGNMLQSCAAAAAAGVGKELYDSMGHGNVEAMDAIATTAGCLTWEIEF